jgi:O-antigen/teichoic acid export membrane protein
VSPHRKIFASTAAGSASYIASTIVPIGIGLLCVPATLHEMGVALFGVLTLYWTIVTFLSNFDFGVSQTIIKLLATSDQNDLSPQQSSYVAAGHGIQLAIGTVISACLLGGLFLLPAAQQQLILHDHPMTLALFLVTVPLLSVSVSARATLEAKRDFQYIAAISLANGTTQFLFPFLMVQRGAGLDAIIAAMLCQRTIVLVMMIARSRKRFAMHWTGMDATASAIPTIWQAGSWIALSSLLISITAYLDRFLLPFFFPLQVITRYTLPMEFLLRLAVFPNLINRVVYSLLHLEGETGEARRAMVYRMTSPIMSAGGLLVLLGAPLLPWFMKLWLGSDIGPAVGEIAQIAAIGLSFMGVSFLSNSMLIALGRPDVEPKALLGLFPFVVAALIFASYQESLLLVAIIFSARVAIHSTILCVTLATALQKDRHIPLLQIGANLAASLLLVLFIAAQ